MATSKQQQTLVQVTRFSKLPKLEGLDVIQGDIPIPQEGEVLCQILVRPVNPTDVHAIQGLRPIGPHHTPHIAGGEGEYTGMHEAARPIRNGAKAAQGPRYLCVSFPAVRRRLRSA